MLNSQQAFLTIITLTILENSLNCLLTRRLQRRQWVEGGKGVKGEDKGIYEGREQGKQRQEGEIINSKCKENTFKVWTVSYFTATSPISFPQLPIHKYYPILEIVKFIATGLKYSDVLN